ncbi:SigE family RNA polymerase sigma factor [Streptomyces sp. SID13031]|uniref:SigE family RNA polymerase sigma factor n=1 Tax=Streptomyces sp. SID13031 TaxID=2706046 RepID=UPI0013C733CC|nr:SigE family RNA polymerase sigma factor [Streptomyces sp. SID13031]NEA33161.1 SigE family RNA polymerase sigma factor [Streptomyces sp. SID13031]
MSVRDQEFSDFVQARRSRLVGAAYLLCGDRHTAEDLVQTALAKLYAAWPKIHSRGAEDAYVLKILVNTTIDAGRRRWRRELISDELPEQSVPGPDLDGRDELVRALATLGPKQRRIVVLRYWLDLSVEEVAADLRISHGTVKSQSSRALDHLRARLTAERIDALTEERA